MFVFEEETEIIYESQSYTWDIGCDISYIILEPSDGEKIQGYIDYSFAEIS